MITVLQFDNLPLSFLIWFAIAFGASYSTLIVGQLRQKYGQNVEIEGGYGA